MLSAGSCVPIIGSFDLGGSLTAPANSLALAWTNPSGTLTGNKVYRSLTSGTETLFATLGVTTAYADTTTVGGTQYFYKVSASNAGGESALSNEASATEPPSPPDGALGTASGALLVTNTGAYLVVKS